MQFEEDVGNINSNNILAFNVDYHKLYFKLDNFDITYSVHLNLRLKKIETYLNVAMAGFNQALFEKIDNLEKKTSDLMNE